MSSFDPDAFLKQYESGETSDEFDPDRFLAEYGGAELKPTDKPPGFLDNLSSEVSKFPAAVASALDTPTEAFADTAEVFGQPEMAQGLRNVFDGPGKDYVSAAESFVKPAEGEFNIAGFAPQYAPRAMVEQTGQMLGSIASSLLGRAIGFGVGAAAGPKGMVAGAAAGTALGPFLFEALQIVGPVAKERAKNNNRAEPNAEDVSTALTTAAAGGALNALGARFLPGGEKATLPFAKRIAASFAGEAITESGQASVEQLGGSAFTEAGVQYDAKQALAEGLIGGASGAGMTSVDAGVRKATDKVFATADKVEAAAPATAEALRELAADVVVSTAENPTIDEDIANEALDQELNEETQAEAGTPAPTEPTTQATEPTSENDDSKLGEATATPLTAAAVEGQEPRFTVPVNGGLQTFQAPRASVRQPIAQLQPQGGQTVKSPGSYPGAEGSIPSPATTSDPTTNPSEVSSTPALNSAVAPAAPETTGSSELIAGEGASLPSSKLQEIEGKVAAARESGLLKSDQEADAYRRNLTNTALEEVAQVSPEPEVLPISETPVTSKVVAEATPTPDAKQPEFTEQPKPEGGETNEGQVQNNEEGQGREEDVMTPTGEGAGVTTAPEIPSEPSEKAAAAPPTPTIEEFDETLNSVDTEEEFQEAISNAPADVVLSLFRQEGVGVDEVVSGLYAEDGDNVPRSGETYSEWAERTGGDISHFDDRPVRMNNELKIYEPVGESPVSRIIKRRKGERVREVTPEDLAPVKSFGDRERERIFASAPIESREETPVRRLTDEELPTEVAAAAKAPPKTASPPAPVTSAGAKQQGFKTVVKKNGIVPTRTNEQGEVEFEFVNDPAMMAEALHASGGGRRIYVPDGVAEGGADGIKGGIKLSVEESTGRVYVSEAAHPRYPAAPIKADGKTESGETLLSLYQKDPNRAKRSATQTAAASAKKGVSADEFVHPLEEPATIEKIESAPKSEVENKTPEKVKKTLAAIANAADKLAGEAYTANDGTVYTFGATIAERIGAAASRLYLGRLRGVMPGEKIYAYDLVSDVKPKFLQSLKSRTKESSSLQDEDANGNERGDSVASEEATEEARAKTRETAPTLTEAQVSQATEDAAEASVPAEKATSSGSKTEKLLEIYETALAKLPEDVRVDAVSAFQKRKENQSAKLTKWEQAAYAQFAKLLIAERDNTPDYDGLATFPADQLTESERNIVEGLRKLADRKLIDKNMDEVIALVGSQNIQFDDLGEPYVAFDDVIGGLLKKSKLPPHLKIILKMFRDAGHDFSAVNLHFTTDASKEWVGLYVPGQPPRIILNLTVGNDSMARVLAHEAMHHVSYTKLRQDYKRNAVEKRAYNDLKQILGHIRKLTISDEELATSGLKRSQAAKKIAAEGGVFYGLKDVDELFSELLTNQQFAKWLAGQKAIPGVKVGNRSWFRNLLEQVKALFALHVYGEEIPSDSLIMQALDRMLDLTGTPADPGAGVGSKATGFAPKAAMAAKPLEKRFDFKAKIQLDKMLEGKGGNFKGITPAADGTVPWENLKAKIDKTLSKEEAEMVTPMLETLLQGGRVNAKAAADALRFLSEKSVRVVELSAVDASGKPKEAAITHELDTRFPGWQQRNEDDRTPEEQHLRDQLDDIIDDTDDAIGETGKSEAASARYTTVNPKPLDQMEGAQDITIEEPYNSEEALAADEDEMETGSVPRLAEEARKRRKDAGVKFSENTHFPTRKNVIGFGRMYTETLPNGEKATFVFEVQTDWDDKTTFNGRTKKWDAVVGNLSRSFDTEAEADAWRDSVRKANTSPLLPVYENLVLKAAIQDALSKGQTKLVITDAETAMMTEGHDKYAVAKQVGRFKDNEIEFDELINRYPKPRYAIERYSGYRQGDAEWVVLDENTLVVSQSPGMTAAYDPATGRLHNIMRKLTGDRGQKVDLGVHQNQVITFPNNAGKFVVRLPSGELAPGKFSERGKAEQFAKRKNGSVEDASQPQGSPVFKNPDGTPKTNITGIVYDLSKLAENPEPIQTLFAQPKTTGQAVETDEARLVQKVTEAYPNIKVEETDTLPAPAAAIYRDNTPVILVNPALLSRDLGALRPEDREAYVRKLILGHEMIHTGAIIYALSGPDSQGRTGMEKLEAFYDYMSEEAKMETAERYVSKWVPNREEVVKKTAQDKRTIAAEFLRMQAELRDTGFTEEQIFDNLRKRTGNNFTDALQMLQEYLRGLVVRLKTNLKIAFDPYLAVQLASIDKYLGMVKSQLPLEKQIRQDDAKRQEAWWEDEAIKAGYDSWASTPEGFKQAKMKEWRDISPWLRDQESETFAAVSKKPKKMVRRTFEEVENDLVPEDPPVPFAKTLAEAENALKDVIRGKTKYKTRGLGDHEVNFAYPDDKMAKRFNLRDGLSGRIWHATHESQGGLRYEVSSPSKIKTAPLIFQTVRQADVTGEGYFSQFSDNQKARFFVKTYKDGADGKVFHTVVTDLNGNFITQYSSPDLKEGSVSAVLVDDVGQGVPRSVGTSEAYSEVDATIVASSTPNSSPANNTDTTPGDSVQENVGPMFASQKVGAGYQRKPTSALSRALLGVNEEARRILSESTYIASDDRTNDEAAQNWLTGIIGQQGATLEDASLALSQMAKNPMPPLSPQQQTLAKAHIAERYGRLSRLVANDIAQTSNYDQLPLVEFYRDEHVRLLNELQERLSIAGQDLQIGAAIANLFYPDYAEKSYTDPFTKTQRTRLNKDGMADNVREALEEARKTGAEATVAAQKSLLDKVNRVNAKKANVSQPAVDMVQGIFDFFFQVDRNLGGTGFPVTEDLAHIIADKITKTLMPKKAGANKAQQPFLAELETEVRKRVAAELSPLLSKKADKTAEESIREGVKKMISDYGIIDAVVVAVERAQGAVLNTPGVTLSPEARQAVEDFRFDPATLKGAEQVVRAGLDFKELIYKTAGERTTALMEFTNKLVTDYGLTGQTAEAVGKAIKSRFEAETKKAAAARLAALVREKKAPARLSDSERLLRLVNLGGFSEAQFYNALAKTFGLPTYSEETAAKLREEAERIQTLPKGSDIRNEATIRLMGDIAEGARKSLLGFDKWKFILGDLAPAVWQASILTGPPTHMVNYGMTLMNIGLQSFASASGYGAAALRKGASVQDVARFYLDFFKAANTTYAAKDSVAKMEALRALTTGTTRFKNAKLEDVSLLERMGRSDNTTDKVLSTYKWVGRLMLATDALNSGLAQEVRMRHALRYAAMLEGKAGRDLEQAVLDAFEPDADTVKAIDEQIAREEKEGVFAGAAKPELAKRIRREELIESRRGEDIVQDAQEAAGRWTFNGDPKGIAGYVFDGIINGMNRKLRVTKFLFPFMRTMGSLIDAALDFTPGVGQLRAYNVRVSRLLGEGNKYAHKMIEPGSPEFFAQQARAWGGTMALAAIVAMVAKGLEDEEEGKEPFFMAYGAGPDDKFKRDQMIAAGWQANSVKIGDRYFRYTDWPALNIALAAVGNLADFARENRDKDTPVSTKLGLAFLGTAAAITEKSMLGGVNNLLTMIRDADNNMGLAALGRFMTSPVAGVTNPPLFQWLRNTLFMDEGGKVKAIDRSGFDGIMHSMVPFWIGRKEALNVLGEPIEEYWYGATTRRFGVFTTVDEHPIMTPLAKAGLFVPSPSKSSVINVPGHEKPMSLARAGDEAWRAYLVYRGEFLKQKLTPDQIKVFVEAEDKEAAQTVLNGPAYKGESSDYAKRMVEKDIRAGKLKVAP